jgi:hypothetical protein
MVDVDFGPGVFMGIIAFVFTAPALYGLLFVDAFWKQHQEEGGNDDVFN